MCFPKPTKVQRVLYILKVTPNKIIFFVLEAARQTIQALAVA